MDWARELKSRANWSTFLSEVLRRAEDPARRTLPVHDSYSVSLGNSYKERSGNVSRITWIWLARAQNMLAKKKLKASLYYDDWPDFSNV